MSNWSYSYLLTQIHVLTRAPTVHRVSILPWQGWQKLQHRTPLSLFIVEDFRDWLTHSGPTYTIPQPRRGSGLEEGLVGVEYSGEVVDLVDEPLPVLLEQSLQISIPVHGDYQSLNSIRQSTPLLSDWAEKKNVPNKPMVPPNSLGQKLKFGTSFKKNLTRAFWENRNQSYAMILLYNVSKNHQKSTFCHFSPTRSNQSSIWYK